MTLPVTPDLAGFRERAGYARVISVRARLLADDLTPLALYHQLCGTRPGTFLLESAEQGVWSRWSFVGVASTATLIGRGDRASWVGRPVAGVPQQGRPLEVLRATLDALHTDADPQAPAFSSGMVGYLGYDIIRQLEHLPTANPDDLNVPDMAFMMVSDLAVLDHHRGEVWLIANAVNYDGSDERVVQAYEDAVRRVQAMARRLAQPRPSLVAMRGQSGQVDVHRQRTSQEFADLVVRAQQYIRAGDVFQVVPSQRFDVPTHADPLAVYRELRVTNPSPYLFLLRFADFSLVGSSPESLVTVRDGRVTTHPIAGTRPRGADAAGDAALERDLLADEKERAEHVMLVDLGRNDLGRVCEPGTVQVTEFMQVRRYSHVMHLEASVTGRLADGCTALDATLACFPAGTLSGAPKVRAMQIIDELEMTRRGPYGGAVGYFDFAGNADAAITIRSAVIKDGWAHVQAGAGIVADSVPLSEDAECRNKAAAVLQALGQAEELHPLGREAERRDSPPEKPLAEGLPATETLPAPVPLRHGGAR